MRAARLGSRWRKFDLLLTAVRNEIGNLFVIALALTILCAPWAFGLGVSWAVASWATALSHSPVPGWILGVTVFAFFYVWGSRLQRVSRHAAEALIAGK